MNAMINDTPWDAAAFGLHTAEIVQYTPEALQLALQKAGHYTITVDPLADKRLLHEHGFYYCDTLLEPYCAAARLRPYARNDLTLARDTEWPALRDICRGAFAHARFSRDFNLPRERTEVRYENWLRQLYDQHQVYGLFHGADLAGFIGYAGNNLVLHAVAEAHRGQGLAKYWWSAVCAELFAAGHAEVKSSISAANVAVLNLYASLGFSFRKPLDVYHRLVT